MTLRFIRPAVPGPEHWAHFLEEAFEARWFSNFGRLASRLEADLAARYGAGREALLCASGTAGLTAALIALGVRGRVAVPAFTFPATLQAVLAAGADPLLVDVDPATWALTPQSLDPAWDRGLEAVIAVRPFGLCHDFAPLHRACMAHGVPLVIDAAAALGGVLPGGDAVGTQGDMEVFSLHATKVFAVGEGGLILAPPEYGSALKEALNFGLHDGVPQGRAINGKFSEFHAAIGLAMLAVFEDHVAHRRRLARRYLGALRQRVAADFAPPDGQPVWQAFPVCLSGDGAAAMVEAAAARGVEVRRYYTPALSATPLARQCAAMPCPGSESLGQRMICLPLYSDMTDAECDRVIEVVLEAASEVNCALVA